MKYQTTRKVMKSIDAVGSFSRSTLNLITAIAVINLVLMAIDAIKG